MLADLRSLEHLGEVQAGDRVERPSIVVEIGISRRSTASRQLKPLMSFQNGSRSRPRRFRSLDEWDPATIEAELVE